ncbi:hypothetical protein Hte_005216 [Hypoxylon texense]
MGTRNLICIRVNRKWVVAKYCQWDGYPTGQGVYLFNFLHVEGNIERLRAGLDHVYTPTKDELKEFREAAEAEKARLEKLDPMDIYNYLAPRWGTDFLHRRKPEDLNEHDICVLLSSFHSSGLYFPSLSRSLGGEILELIADATTVHRLPVKWELEFARNWLYCEWAYIVDLDEMALKVFGSREPNHKGHPFEEVCRNALDVPKFMASFTFAELRSWDEEAFKKRAEDIEEEAKALWKEHNVVVEERLTKVGIVMSKGGDPNGDNADEADTSEDEASEDEASEDEASGDEASEEDAGEDANWHDVDGDGADEDGVDAAASQIDRLHLS